MTEVAVPKAINEASGLHCRHNAAFSKEPDFGVTSVNYNLNDLLAISEEPQ